LNISPNKFNITGLNLYGDFIGIELADSRKYDVKRTEHDL
jgi:hypothetical protein